MARETSLYDSTQENKWCPGCGNFGLLKAMKRAYADLGLPPQRAVIVSGIGQSGKTPHFMNCTGFQGLHGRALPLAAGAKLANHELKILVNTGDGDCLGEGGNHFLHALRRNIELTILIHDNKVFGLTKGQPSPTADQGMVTKFTPRGVLAEGLNPLALALTIGAVFVARGFTGEVDHLAGLITAGLNHPGTAVIHVLQPCPSFNKLNTHRWYAERVYRLEESGHDPADFPAAWAKAWEWGEKIPLGLFFRKAKPGYAARLPQLQAGPLLDRTYDQAALRAVLAEL